MARTRDELLKAIEALGPLDAPAWIKQDCLETLERTKDQEGYLAFLKKAKNSKEMKSDIEHLSLGLAKRKYDYLEFIKTKTGKKCEAFKQQLKRCIEEYKNATAQTEEAEIEKWFDAVYAEIKALPKKEREIIWEELRGYAGQFARVSIDKKGLKWHFGALKTMPSTCSTTTYSAAPNKKFGKPLFDENISKEHAERLARQASDMVSSYLSSKSQNFTIKSDKFEDFSQQVKLVFASTSKEAVEEVIRLYGKQSENVRREALKTFIVESCPAMYDEKIGRIIFNLDEICKGRTQAEAEFYLLQTAIHEYLHPFGGLPKQGLRWINEGIVERISYDICESTGKKLNRIESGYAPYMSALKWLNDLGIENKVQENAYFTRNPQLLIDEMARIGMTQLEIDRLIEYGSRIDIKDKTQADLYAFGEFTKKIRKRIAGEPNDSQNIVNQLADVGLIYEKRDLSSIKSEDDLQNYLKGAFSGANEEQIKAIQEAISFSQKTHGNDAPTPLNMAEMVQEKLLEYRNDFQAKPDSDVFLELFLQREILWINNLRFRQRTDTSAFEIINADEVLGKIGIDLDLGNSVRLAARALGYLTWKNIHEPSIEQVVEVILRCKERAEPNNQTWENIGAEIDKEGIAFASKTRDEMHDIYKNKTSDANLLKYIAGVGYPKNKPTVDGIQGLFGLAQKIAYPGDWLLIHPELGIVRTDIEGDILPQYSFSIGGSYDLMMYTAARFSKIMPLVDNWLI
ncbi:TPA: hypothetical protein HA243_05035 [Candidatus Micrarchaeota archaeon]|nr:hypothetical protein [Candidatus Micrarchaeota archaeon]